MNYPLVSIIIPVYKVEAYLAQCLDSVLHQTLTEWECILVDDGSPDGSGVICDAYVSTDSRFRVIHKENGGVSSARNVALETARGEYVAFMDSDDLWSPKVLERVCRSFETEGVDWVRISYTNFKDKENPPIVSDDDCMIRYVFRENVLKEGCAMLQKVGYPFLNFFKRILIKETRFPLGIRFREDAIFLYEMVTKSKGLLIDTYPGYLRRQVSGSAMYSPRHSDDSSKLYEAFIAMLNRTNTQYPDLSQWFYKDLTQWLGGCPNIKAEDDKNTLLQLRKIDKLGVINYKSSTEKIKTLRLMLYIKTGCKAFLYISHHNPFGKVRMYKTNMS